MIMIVALSIPCMARERSRRCPVCAGRRAARTRVSVVARNLAIKVTAGATEPERCNQAFTVAATAVASGVPVSLWLTGEAAWFALPGRAAEVALPHALPPDELRAAPLDHPGRHAGRHPHRRRDHLPGRGHGRRSPGPRLLDAPPLRHFPWS